MGGLARKNNSDWVVTRKLRFGVGGLARKNNSEWVVATKHRFGVGGGEAC